MFVVCCVGSDLCDKLITRSEGSCRVCVVPQAQERGGLSPSRVVAKKNYKTVLYFQVSIVCVCACVCVRARVCESCPRALKII
jgi:hypothetical protein